MSPEDFDYAPRGPFILGIPLGDLSFSAFSSKKMFDRRWHLRAERFGAWRSLPSDTMLPRCRAGSLTVGLCETVVYQLAMLICLAAECTATYSYAKCVSGLLSLRCMVHRLIVRFLTDMRTSRSTSRTLSRPPT